MRNRIHDYCDKDITFYVQVFKEVADIRICLKYLRRYYKESRIILISDGDNDPRYRKIACRYKAEYIAGERLYTVENGGRMIQRMFNAYLEKPSDYLIKLDPDTRVHRRFRYLPYGKIIFGTLEWQTVGCKTPLNPPNVQGGCIGFTSVAAREITESGLLLSDELLDYRNTYADNFDIIDRAENAGLISFDFITRYVCRCLNISPVPFDEVYSVYRGNIASHGEDYAVTHPHKAPPNNYLKRIVLRVRKIKKRLAEN